VLEVADGKLVEKQAPMLNALNEVLRDDFIKDSVAGIGAGTRAREGRRRLPAGRSAQGVQPQDRHAREHARSPDGRVIGEAEWKAHEREWLPTPEDRAFVASLMGRVTTPGKFASWIAPPPMGINKQPSTSSTFGSRRS
jgi:benzoyl-CoA 2,3-dioxygenase component B